MSTTNYEPGAHYDRVTEAWTLLLGDELHYGVFDTGREELSVATRRMTDLMIDAAELTAGMSVLDVGCGTGAPACRLAEERAVRVTGITTSAEGVRAAQARATALDLAGIVRFELRDGMANGFADNSFDVVWALESSHLMRRRDKLIAESSRVLRAGGRIVLCDIVLKHRLGLAEVRKLREPLWLLREVFGDARMEPGAEYVRLGGLCDLVFEPVIDLTARTRPTFSRWRANADTHGDSVAALIGRPALERFVAACDVLERFWDEGLLGYALLAGDKPRL